MESEGNELSAALQAVIEADQQGDLEKASRLAEEAVSRFPDSAELWARLASLRLWRGNREGATEALLKARELGRDLAVTHAAAADIFAFDGIRQEAKAEARRALAAGADDPWVLVKCANAYVVDEEGELALQLATQVRDMQPESSWAHCNLINHLNMLGKKQEAEAALAEAERRFPDSPLVWHQRARRLVRSGSIDDALDQYQRAAEAMPGSPYVLGETALMLANLGRDNAGERMATRALEISSACPAVYSALAAVSRRRGLRRRAVELDRKAVNAVPGVRAALTVPAANAMVTTGKAKKAVRVLDELLPELTGLSRNSALETKMRALLNLRRFAEATAVLAELEHSQATAVDVPILKGRLLAAQGRLEEAVEHYRTALIEYPDSGRLRAGLLRCLHALGRREGLSAAVEEVWQNLPQHPLGFADVSDALYKCNLIEDGRRMREAATEHYSEDVMIPAFASLDMFEIGRGGSDSAESAQWYMGIIRRLGNILRGLAGSGEGEDRHSGV